MPPTETRAVRVKAQFWAELDHVVKVLYHGAKTWFVLMDANACTGKRGRGSEDITDNKMLGTYRRNTLNENSKRKLSFADESGPGDREGVFQHAEEWYIVFLQWSRFETYRFNPNEATRPQTHVRNVTVHLQPASLSISNHNDACT